MDLELVELLQTCPSFKLVVAKLFAKIIKISIMVTSKFLHPHQDHNWITRTR